MQTDITEYEKLRHKFRPSDIRVLFIGESRPHNGTFFYLGNSNLAFYSKAAFEVAFNTEFGNVGEFLAWFKRNGFYLDDLCPDPVNHLVPKERRSKCKENIHSLSGRLSEYAPEFLIVTPKKIKRYITKAVKCARDLEMERHDLPFPACGHQNEYVKQLTKILSERFPDLIRSP